MKNESLTLTLRTATRGKVVSKKTVSKVSEVVVPMTLNGRKLEVLVSTFV